jgi:hypothetical protein
MRVSAVLTAISFVLKLRETTTSPEKASTTATSKSSDSDSSRTLAHRPRRSFVNVPLLCGLISLVFNHYEGFLIRCPPALLKATNILCQDLFDHCLSITNRLMGEDDLVADPFPEQFTGQVAVERDFFEVPRRFIRFLQHEPSQFASGQFLTSARCRQHSCRRLKYREPWYTGVRILLPRMSGARP